MDKLSHYRTCIQQLLKQYEGYPPSSGEIETEVITDTEHDHYELVNVGWHNNRRIRGSVLHIDLKNNKIWIQHDGTEQGVANDLVALGVPREDIVLAFHAPYKRQFTGFATN